MKMVAHSVVACPESALDQVGHFYADSENDLMMITVPDSENQDCIRTLHQRAASLGTGPRKRCYSQANSKCVVELRVE